MRVPYPPEARAKNALGTWNHRNGMFLLVDTDEGVVGVGEIWSNFPQWSHYEKEATVHQGLKPLVLGMDPLDIQAIWDGPGKILNRIGLQWGAVGIVSQVMSGLDIALWDICGKVQGKPLCSLLGREPGELPVYCSGLGPNNVVEDARRLMDQGVDSFKLKIGMDRDRDLKNLRDLRGLIGDKRRLLVDVNQGWDLKTALEMAPILESMGLYWVEEPLVANDMEGLHVLRERTDLRISGGENLYGGMFRQYMSQGLFHVCQPDITKCGGITGFLKVTECAASYGVEIVPHFFGNGVGYAATIHAARAKGVKLMEHDCSHNPMRDDCVQGLGPIHKGGVPIPTKPGLGIDLVEDKIDAYRFSPYPV